MSQNYSCPVCGRCGLPHGCARCPQCDADLTCFQVLDVLADPLAAKPATKSRRRPLAILILLAAALLAILAWSMGRRVKELEELQADVRPRLEQPVAPASSAAVAVSASNPQEELAAPQGGSHVDIEVKAAGLDMPTAGPSAAGSQNEAASSGTGEENNSVGPSSAAVGGQQAEQWPPTAADSRVMEEALTAAETMEPAVAAPPAEAGKAAEKAGGAPVDEAQFSFQPPSAEAVGRTSETTAASPVRLPVLKATPKRWVKRLLPVLAASLEENHAENAAAEPPPPRQASSAKMFLYQAQDGETLQDIAERFYGDRRYYPVILDQNPYLISSVNNGNWMRLFVNASQAAAIYESRTVKKDGLLLWRYEIRPGETWRTIYARFFPSRYSGRVFYEKNPQIIPGRTVLIILR